MDLFGFRSPKSYNDETTIIQKECDTLTSIKIRGNLGVAIARLILQYAPRDIRKMVENFGDSISDVSADYREELKTAIAGHLLGTYQSIRLMNQQGAFSRLKDPLSDNERAYWDMVKTQCKPGSGDVRLRFLKFLLGGFCMIVQKEPGHPVGLRFPGGDKVELIEGVYYCPVQNKANDVESALCPFCPAQPTPEIGYLKPPVNASEHRKQEFIDNCYRYHNFNG